jgi:putative inorganic carbon (HCO3(-)) transporter
VVANVLKRPRQLEHLVLALLSGLMLQAVYGLGQYFFNLKLGLAKLGEADSMNEDVGGVTSKRIGALMGHPNLLSGYLAMVMPMALAVMFTRLRMVVRVFAGAALGLSAVAMVLTLSRNGWVSFAFAAVVIVMLTMLHTEVRRKTHALRMVLMAGGFVVMLAASGTIIDRFTRSDPMNMSARWELNRVAFRMIMDRPIVGHGKNSLAYVMTRGPRYRLKKWRSVSHNPEAVPPIHNIYLQQFAEQGVIGLVIFLSMLGMVLRVGVDNLKTRDPTMYAISIGAMGGILAIMTHGLIDWIFWWNGIHRLYFLLAGIMMAVRYWRLTYEGSGASEVMSSIPSRYRPTMLSGETRP